MLSTSLALLSIQLIATAQSVPQISTSLSDFATEADFAALRSIDRGRNVSVQERRQPAYDARGISLPAGLRFFPSAALGAGYVDNLYRTTDGTSDAYATLRPSFNVRSEWIRHSLSFGANGDFKRYRDYSTEDQNGWRANTDGTFELNPYVALQAGASFAKRYEERGGIASPVDSLGPVEYSNPQVYIGTGFSARRARFSLMARATEFDYEDVTGLGGVILDQDFRDERIYRVQGKAEFGILPSTAAFIQITQSRNDFTRTTGIEARDSSDLRALVGVNFDLTSLIRGEIGAGYVRRSFNSAAVEDIEGLAVLAGVEYFPTQLTTLALRLRRTVEDTTLVDPSTLFANSAALQMDHELLRNLKLNFTVAVRKDQFQRSSREDRYVTTSVGARYLLSPEFQLLLGAGRVSRRSNDAAAAPRYGGLDLSLRFVVQR